MAEADVAGSMTSYHFPLFSKTNQNTVGLTGSKLSPLFFKFCAARFKAILAFGMEFRIRNATSSALSSTLLASSALADHRHEHRRSLSLNRLGQSSTKTPNGEVKYTPDSAGVLMMIHFRHCHIHRTRSTKWFVGHGYAASVDFRDGPAYQAKGSMYPDSQHIFSDITISPGDDITLSVRATSDTTGVSRKHDFESTSAGICFGGAEFIVQSEMKDAESAPFTGIAFSNAIAIDNSGTYMPSDGATVFDVKPNDQVLAKTSVSGSTITITYEQ
ncbi:hypothetical protein V8E55_011534 [Tylopilus felleus]